MWKILSLFFYSVHQCYSAEKGTVPATTSCTTLPKSTFGTAPGDWNYVNELQWSSLGYPQCAGQHQSPIDIDTTQVVSNNQTAATLKYLNSSQVNIKLKNYTIEVQGHFSQVYALDSSGKYQYYDSTQFHIHEPSEHTINGYHYPLELHIVHLINQTFCGTVQNVATVVGVMFEIDNTQNDFLQKFANVGSTPTTIDHFNLYNSILDKVPTPTKAYTYSGSLTTPGCAQVVNWIILQNTVRISPLDFQTIQEKFNDHHLFNNGINRMIQARNDRVVQLQPVSIKQVSQFAQNTFTLMMGLSILSLMLI